MMSSKTLSFFVVIICCHLTVAQIPRVCSDEISLSNKTCCPVPNIAGAGPCGSSTGINRGNCVETSTLCNTRYTRENDETEPRLNWPSYFFTEVCECNGNYGGYDCGECKFGYEGDDCNTKKPIRTRKSVNDADMPWDDYVMQLNKLKMANDSRYVIVLFNEDANSVTDDDYKIRNISIYNLFAWMHHYVAKTNNDSYAIDSSANDYAHESSGFLTWHRLFLLWFEREAQIFLEDPNFTLRYWNWTVPENREDLFLETRLGGNDESAGGTLTGNFDDWETVCWFPDGSSNKSQTCDPTNQDGVRRLIRCPIPEDCTANSNYWPTADSVENALTYSAYRDRNDEYPFNKYALNGFSNRLEGFILSKDPDSSDGSILGYDDDNGTECNNPNTDCKYSNRQPQPFIPIKRELHNLVHIILGIGSLDNARTGVIGNRAQPGVMADVAASANDPVFLNHHTMVDRLFEQWLQNQPSPQYVGPVNDRKFAGHSENDCIVPFIPYYTHRDMFKKASEFGYEYDGLESGNQSGGLSSELKIVISVIGSIVGIIILILVVILLIIVIKRNAGKQVV